MCGIPQPRQCWHLNSSSESPPCKGSGCSGNVQPSVEGDKGRRLQLDLPHRGVVQAGGQPWEQHGGCGPLPPVLTAGI